VASKSSSAQDARGEARLSDHRYFIMRYDGEALRPVNAAEREAMAVRLYPGEDVAVHTVKQRSLPQLKYYWVKLKELLDSGAAPRLHDIDAIHDALKLEMGFVTPFITMRGRIEFRPKSIAMDKLDQDEMNAFIDRAWALIAEHWGVDMETIGYHQRPPRRAA
jgi:hypothetical protein